MRCPSCKTGVMEQREVEPGLAAMTCAGCAGMWIKAVDYLRWREAHGGEAKTIGAPGAGPLPEVVDSKAGKLCPECGSFLVRHPVGHDIAFHLDRCGNCGGIWLDANEWEQLRARGLHESVHIIFSETWQAECRRAQHARNEDALLSAKLGADTLNELKRIKRWIDTHPSPSTLRAYLTK